MQPAPLQQGKQLAALWVQAAHTPRTGGAQTKQVLDRGELARFVRQLLPPEAQVPRSLWYMHACLSTELGDELTLNEFTRQVKEGAKAGAAAEAPTPETSPKRKAPAGAAGAAAGALGASDKHRNDAALTRVAAGVDAAVGPLKRRFNRGGACGAFALSPEEMSSTLAAASFAPADIRAVLAELRVWEGYPQRVRFLRFRRGPWRIIPHPPHGVAFCSIQNAENHPGEAFLASHGIALWTIPYVEP